MSAPTPARATRRATRERSRAAAGNVAASLPPDTLRVICLSLKGGPGDLPQPHQGRPDDAARSLLCMQQTCKSWRAALRISEDEIWKELALERFPSLRGILRLEPTTAPYRRLYFQQLLGERAYYPCMRPPLDPGPEMSAYIFSCELYVDHELIGGSTIIGENELLNFMVDIHAGPTTMAKWERLLEEWMKPIIAETHSLHLRVSVTRRADLSTIVLYYDDELDDGEYDPGDAQVAFTHMAVSLPSKMSAFGLGTWQPPHGNLHTLEIAPTISVSDHGRSCQCECEIFNGSDPSTDVTERLVRTYFTHYAPWPDVPA